MVPFPFLHIGLLGKYRILLIALLRQIKSSLLSLSAISRLLEQKQSSMLDMSWSWGRVAWSRSKPESGWSLQVWCIPSISPISDPQPCMAIISVLWLPFSSNLIWGIYIVWYKKSCQSKSAFMEAQHSPGVEQSVGREKSSRNGISGCGSGWPPSSLL